MSLEDTIYKTSKVSLMGVDSEIMNVLRVTDISTTDRYCNRGGKWVDFEEYPGYQIRHCPDRVVEVRKKGTLHCMIQKNREIYVWTEGVRTMVYLPRYYDKYSKPKFILDYLRG